MALSIRINPGVLKWVMDNEGWNADELAKESGLSASQIRLWTSTESDIGIRDLRKMSDNFKRSMSVLFMDEVPSVGVPRFRQAGCEEGARRFSRDTLDVIRVARYVQGNAGDLMRETGKKGKSVVPIATVEQDPESAAAKSAKILCVETPSRTGSDGGRDMRRYRDIRERIESQGVFTMEAPIPPEDGVSGLALAEPAPAVILVNSRDHMRRRIFALLHEYAHVALKDVGVACAVDDWHGGGDAGGGGTRHVERWCNRFAGAVLMPRPEFGAALQNARGEDRDPLRVVTVLSDRFCVDRAVALARTLEILDGDAIAPTYSRCCEQIGRGRTRRGGDAGGGGEEDARVPRAAACMERMGYKYARMVIDAEESGIITTNTALDYLGIKLSHWDDLRAWCGAC